MKKQAVFLGLTFVLVCIFAVSAVSASIGPSTDVYVSPTGNDSNTGTLLSPYKTISWGIENVAEKGNVHLAAGTYSQYYPKDIDHRDYGIFINKNITIIGAGEDQTIIDAQDKNRVFAIDEGKSLSLKNLTIRNGTAIRGGAIENYGSFGAENVKFDHNKAYLVDLAGGEGGAIYNSGYSWMEYVTFTNNTATSGGAIYNTASMTMFSGTFDNNSAGYGGAIWNSGNINLAYFVFSKNYVYQYAAAIYAHGGDLFVTDSTFSENIAELDAAINCDSNADVTITDNKFINNYEGISLNLPFVKRAQITGNQFIGNLVGIQIHSGELLTDPYVHINFNRFFGNTYYGIQFIDYSNMSTYKIDATLNWWGSNAGPNKLGSDKTYGSVNYTPWMVLKLFIPSKTIYSGSVTKITASFLYDSYGNYHNPVYGHIPDGTPIKFTSKLGQVGSYIKWMYTLDGIAQIVYRAVDPNGKPIKGQDEVTASGDNEELSSSVNIVPDPTVNAASNTVGMQETGIPIAGLILAILAVLGGLVINKR